MIEEFRYRGQHIIGGGVFTLLDTAGDMRMSLLKYKTIC